MNAKREDEDPIQTHDRQAKAITKAVAGLLTRFGPLGFTPEAIFEGAVRGGAVVLLGGTNASVSDVADLLSEVGNEFRDLAKPNFTVVQ